MRAHYFQHVEFEEIGNIKNWLQDKGYRTTHTKFYKSESLPNPEEIDLLIILGGPMSCNDENGYSWMSLEKEFISAMIKLDKSILGICLGAQLIAQALGSKIYTQDHEIGWFPVAIKPSNLFQELEEIVVFHWHSETFDLPRKAINLSSSELCINQGYYFGGKIIGLQFHLEVTKSIVNNITKNCYDTVTPGHRVQSKDDILSVPDEYYTNIKEKLYQILDYLHTKIIVEEPHSKLES